MLSVEPPRGIAAELASIDMRILAFCFLAALVDGMDTQTLAIALPLIARDWSEPLASFGPALVAFSAGLVAGSVAAGWASDKLGRRPTLLIAVTAVGLSTLLVPLTGSIGWLSVVRFVSGCGVGGALVCIIAICTGLVAGNRGSRLALVAYIGAPSGYLIASLGGSRLLATGNWQLLFWASGIITLVLSIVMFLALPDIRRTPAAPPVERVGKQGLGLFSRGQTAVTLLLWVAMLLGFTATYLLLNWLPSILTLAGRSAADAAVTGSVIYVGSILGTLGFAAAALRWPVGPVLAIVYALGTAAAFVVHALGPASGVIASVGLLMLGISVIGGQIALMIFAASLYPPEFRGRGTGWAIGIGRLGSLLGPALGAVLIGSVASRNGIFLALGLIIAACTIAIGLLAWRAGRQSYVATPA